MVMEICALMEYQGVQDNHDMTIESMECVRQEGDIPDLRVAWRKLEEKASNACTQGDWEGLFKNFQCKSSTLVGSLWYKPPR